MLRKATSEEVALYATTKPTYPLGYVSRLPVWTLNENGYYGRATGETLPVFIEDLRGYWGRPDPVWECVGPAGYRFDGELHTMLAYDLKDVRNRLDGCRLVQCNTDCCVGFEKIQREMLAYFFA